MTENRIDFDITSERTYGHARETNSLENEVRSSLENTNELRVEMKLRISEEMDGSMSIVNSQIQRAIKDVISGQVLPKM